jgi:hypothetical protein
MAMLHPRLNVPASGICTCQMLMTCCVMPGRGYGRCATPQQAHVPVCTPPPANASFVLTSRDAGGNGSQAISFANKSDWAYISPNNSLSVEADGLTLGVSKDLPVTVTSRAALVFNPVDVDHQIMRRSC